MSKKCTQSVPKMPSKPENRLKAGGYNFALHVDNASLLLDEAQDLLEKLSEFEMHQPASRYFVQLSIRVTSAKTSVTELEKILANKASRKVQE